MDTPIYKIVPRPLWREAEAKGSFEGATVDLKDGYIHFSTGSQVRETAERHFSGEDDLLLLAIDADALGDALKWGGIWAIALAVYGFGFIKLTGNGRRALIAMG